MKHQEWLIDMNFYQARNSLLEQAISKKAPKCETGSLHQVASEKK